VFDPAIIFSKVDFPEPFIPNTPILAPGKKERLMSFKTSLPPGHIKNIFQL
jgi:hypothetical protein